MLEQLNVMDLRETSGKMVNDILDWCSCTLLGAVQVQLALDRKKWRKFTHLSNTHGSCVL